MPRHTHTRSTRAPFRSEGGHLEEWRPRHRPEPVEHVKVEGARAQSQNSIVPAPPAVKKVARDDWTREQKLEYRAALQAGASKDELSALRARFIADRRERKAARPV